MSGTPEQQGRDVIVGREVLDTEGRIIVFNTVYMTADEIRRRDALKATREIDEKRKKRNETDKQ